MEQKGQRSKQNIKAKYFSMALLNLLNRIYRAFKFRSNENLILISRIQLKTLKNDLSFLSFSRDLIATTKTKDSLVLVRHLGRSVVLAGDC